MSFWYLASTIPAFLTLFGNLTGGIATASNIIFMFGILSILELFRWQDSRSLHKGQDLIPLWILLLHPILLTSVIGTLFFGIHTQILQGPWIWVATVSTGITSGLSGIISAHEFIHRQEKWARGLGIYNLWLVNYGHYYVEHIRVHHRYVGTPRDAVTAPMNENLYKFFLRAIPAQKLSAFKAERSAKGFWNFVTWILIVEILTCLTIGIFLGPMILAAYILNSFVAILLLEYANYVEHYGLVRKEGEKILAEHSWQSNSVVTRYLLLELSRHADHHLRASKPYQKLESLAKTPEMPFGYFGMFYFALIPALWFRIVNPIVENKRWLQK